MVAERAAQSLERRHGRRRPALPGDRVVRDRGLRRSGPAVAARPRRHADRRGAAQRPATVFAASFGHGDGQRLVPAADLADRRSHVGQVDRGDDGRDQRDRAQRVGRCKLPNSAPNTSIASHAGLLSLSTAGNAATLRVRQSTAPRRAARAAPRTGPVGPVVQLVDDVTPGSLGRQGHELPLTTVPRPGRTGTGQIASCRGEPDQLTGGLLGWGLGALAAFLAGALRAVAAFLAGAFLAGRLARPAGWSARLGRLRPAWPGPASPCRARSASRPA